MSEPLDEPGSVEPEGYAEPPRKRSKLFMFVLVYLLLAVLVLLGWLYYRSIPKTAAEQYARAESLEKELARAGGAMKQAEREQFRKRVLESYRKVFEKFPDPEQEFGPRAHRQIARMHEEAGEHAEAVKWYRDCAKRYAKDPGAPDDLQRAAELSTKELKQHRAAGELYRELAEKWASDERASRWMFSAAEILDRKVEGRSSDKAVEAYLRVVEKFPKSKEAPQALYHAAQVRESQKAWKKAAALYLRIEKEYPKSAWAPRAMRRRGELLADRLGKPEQAAKLFKELIEKYPDSKEAAYARSRTGKLEKKAAAKKASDYQSGRYGGGGGGTIYDHAAQWTEARRELYRQIALQKLNVEQLGCQVRFHPSGKRAEFDVSLTLVNGGEPRKDLLFFMGDAFKVGKVSQDGKKVDHDQGEQRLKLFLKKPLASSARTTLRFEYQLDQSKDKPEPIYLTRLDEEGFAMADVGWYPGNVMGDLFEFAASFEVPEGYQVFSLGELVERTRVGEKKTLFRWKSDRPVFGLYWVYGKYREQKVRWKEVDLRLLTRKSWAGSKRTLEAAQEVLAFYSKRFGPYPFKKLWIAQVKLAKPFSGVGPASLLLLNDVHFESDKVPWTVLAHEVAHQWWGNRVPISLFSTKGYSQWLSEGFATYSEVMFMGHRHGPEKMREQLTQYRKLFLDITRNHYEHPLSEALGGGPGYVATVYMKGGWVLHMLRWLIGDQAFDKALATYQQRFAWKNSTIGDFRKICEEVSGQKLEQFFTDWVYNIGCVRYDIVQPARRAAKRPEKGWVVSLELKQRSTKTYVDEKKGKGKQAARKVPYHTPVELVIRGAGKGERRLERLVVLQNPQRYELRVPFEPVEVELDPQDRLLKVPGAHNRHKFK